LRRTKGRPQQPVAKVTKKLQKSPTSCKSPFSRERWRSGGEEEEGEWKGEQAGKATLRKI